MGILISFFDKFWENFFKKVPVEEIKKNCYAIPLSSSNNFFVKSFENFISSFFFVFNNSFETCFEIFLKKSFIDNRFKSFTGIMNLKVFFRKIILKVSLKWNFFVNYSLKFILKFSNFSEKSFSNSFGNFSDIISRAIASGIIPGFLKHILWKVLQVFMWILAEIFDQFFLQLFPKLYPNFFWKFLKQFWLIFSAISVKITFKKPFRRNLLNSSWIPSAISMSSLGIFIVNSTVMMV